MDGGRLRSSDAKAARRLKELDAASLDKRLGLRRRGREDGARDIPPHDAVSLSEAEHDVVEIVSCEQAHIEAARAGVRNDVERRLRALAPSPLDLTGQALDARLMLRQLSGRMARDWAAAVAQAERAREDLAEFRRAHDLRRMAVYPPSTWLQAGLLLTAALFEALFSAALFAEDDARGLLGGAITAIGLSGANVTLGFLSGFLGLRYLQHTRLAVKIGGAAAFVAFALLALMLNLFAADWRDQLAAISGAQVELDADAGFHLWSLLQLDSPQAIILLMLGAGVWVFAALKGYSGFDDPYPDYGVMDRAARAAAERLSELRAIGRRQLEAPIDEARAWLSSRLEKMRAELDSMQKTFDAAAAKMETLDAAARALDDLAAGAIDLYRQENLAARTTPPPAHFRRAAPTPVRADLLAGAAAMIDDARAALARAQAQSNAVLTELLAELDETTTRLDSGVTS